MPALAHKPSRANRSRSLADAIRDYKYNPEHSKKQRVAEFLDWAATHYPKQYVDYPHLAKAVEGYSRMPQHNSKEVELIKSSMSGVNRMLQTKYGRALDAEPGVGVRATVDDADLAMIVLPKKMKRIDQAKKAATQVANLVDPSKIPDTPENKPWKQWVKVHVRDVLKTINSPEFEQKLLPPAPVADNGDDSDDE